jgi:hypothetical protein
MEQNFLIEDHDVYDSVNTSVLIGVGKSIELDFDYLSSSGLATGHFKIKDSAGNTIRQGNRIVPTTGWTDSDDVMYDNFLEVLQLIKKT